MPSETLHRADTFAARRGLQVMGVAWFWIVAHLALYFGSGVIVGFMLALFVRKYQGALVRWEFEEVE